MKSVILNMIFDVLLGLLAVAMLGSIGAPKWAAMLGAWVLIGVGYSASRKDRNDG
ncbi:hypothetical protein ABWU93_11660 [Xanthomonas translucens pv. translucens]|uniref:hypothetical protein n=1 Tax=Xanthomonas campestris pv. translucens TaxID=343 RepID=UPI003F70312D